MRTTSTWRSKVSECFSTEEHGCMQLANAVPKIFIAMVSQTLQSIFKAFKVTLQCPSLKNMLIHWDMTLLLKDTVWTKKCQSSTSKIENIGSTAVSFNFSQTKWNLASFSSPSPQSPPESWSNPSTKWSREAGLWCLSVRWSTTPRSSPPWRGSKMTASCLMTRGQRRTEIPKFILHIYTSCL